MTDPRWQLIAYVFASIVLRLVTAQLSRQRVEVGWVRFLSQRWAAAALRFVYYVGLPYIALILGMLPGLYLGLAGPAQSQTGQSLLSGLELGASVGQILSQLRNNLSEVLLGWLPDIGRLFGLAGLMALLLSLTWSAYSHFRYTVAGWLAYPSQPEAGRSEPWRLETPSLVQVIYQAVHWSFYRGAIWLLADDLYLGVVGGIGLVFVEWMLDPAWADRVRHALNREQVLLDASLLIATASLFLFVPNLWLLLPIHWLLAAVCRRVLRFEPRLVRGQGVSRVGSASE